MKENQKDVINLEVIFRPRYPRPSVRAIRKYCHPSVRSFQNITVRASALFKISPSERMRFLKKVPSERDLKK